MSFSYMQERMRPIEPSAIKAFKKTHRYQNDELAELLGLEKCTIQRWSTGANKIPLWFKYALLGLQSTPILHEVLLRRGGAEQVQMEINRNLNLHNSLILNYGKAMGKEVYSWDDAGQFTADQLASIKKETKPRESTRRELADKKQKEEEDYINAQVEAECGGIAESPPASQKSLSDALTPEQEAERLKLIKERRARKRGVKVEVEGETDKIVRQTIEAPEEPKFVETRTGRYQVHPDLLEPVTEKQNNQSEEAPEVDIETGWQSTPDLPEPLPLEAGDVGRLLDSEGTMFDPELHQVTKKNELPIKDFGKTWRRIKKA